MLISTRRGRHICDQCVGSCVDILARHHQNKARGGDPLSNLERAAVNLQALSYRISRLSRKVKAIALKAEVTVLLNARPDEDVLLVAHAHEVAKRAEAFVESLDIAESNLPKAARSRGGS
jgi:hypothetical protein